MASSMAGTWPERAVMSAARESAWASGLQGGCNLTRVSETRLNWSTTNLNLFTSPADSDDHVSLAETIRLRACASNAGSKRPNWTAS